MVKDRQVKELRTWLQKEATLSLAALKTGMDRKTARKHRRGPLPSERVRAHDWQTRPDAFADVWAEVASRLELALGSKRRPCLRICSGVIRDVSRTASFAHCNAE